MFAHFRSIKGTAALVAALAASLLLAGAPEAATMDIPGDASSSRPIVLAQAGYDPGIAYLSGSQTTQYSRVGRIAVQLVQKGSTTEVPFERPFRTGDEFRFQITTNKDGWLYVLHRSPGGQFQVLYPPATAGAGKSAASSRVLKNQHYLVPQPGEGTFVFDKDTGAETFYLVIKDRQEPPSLNDVVVSSSQSSYQPQSTGGQYYEQPYQAPATGTAGQYPSQPQYGGGQQNQQQYQAPAGQYPAQSPGAGGYYEQPYQAPPTAPATQYPPQPQYGGGQQYQQQYQAPAGQYPAQSPGAGGYYEQPYQAPSTAPAGQYPAQPQYGGGQQYQAPQTIPGGQYPPQPQYAGGQQYQAAPTAPAGQMPTQQQDKAKTQPLLSLNLNYSVIPKAAQKLPGLKYRGVSFKPESASGDPGTYFAPQPSSELQDAWFVFQLNHVQ